MPATDPEASDLGPRGALRSAPAPVPLALARGLAASRTALAAAGVGLLAAVVYLWNLTASGYANAYYSAAALAAAKSWTAWFFGSLDAANFITVDKPPLATMLMGLSVRVFGLSSASILLPEALLGIASVLLLFAIVRRQFGLPAATIAGVVMAATPVAALMFRYDHPDALMTFLMLGSAWATQRAIEDGRHRWLALAGVAVGLAFLTKYLQGVLVGPALVIAYAVAANASVRRRIAGVAVLGASAVATAGAWVAAVELTPASLRPYVGGSTNGSVLDLILGYDGLGRILGASAGQGVGSSFGGEPGILRLFNAAWGGQIAWLLPLAVLAAALGLVVTLRAPRTDVRRAGYLLWGAWLGVHALVFSFMSGIVHSYYAVAMAPAIGALVGAGLVEMWRLRARHPLGGLVLGASTLVTVALASMLLARSADFLPWLSPVVLIAGVAAAALVTAPVASRAYGLTVAGLALAAMLAGPIAFTLDTMATGHTGPIISAGPSATTADILSGGVASDVGASFVGAPPPGFAVGPGGGVALGGSGGPGGGTASSGSGAASASLADYLVANRGDATWVAAAINATTAAELELATGEPVMAIGGWSGNDGAITLDAFKALVAEGRLRYVVAGGQGGPGGSGGNAAIVSWVESVGTAVTVGGTTVYDLSGAVGA